MAGSSSTRGNDMNSFESSTYDSRLQNVGAVGKSLREMQKYNGDRIAP